MIFPPYRAYLSPHNVGLKSSLGYNIAISIFFITVLYIISLLFLEDIFDKSYL